jgi:hypothetical protein
VRVDRRRQPVLRGVGEPDGLIEVVGPDQPGDRPEDLLLGDPHVDRHLVEDRGSDEDASDAHRREWSAGVLRELREMFGDLRGLEFEIHAGREYAEFGLEFGLLAAGAGVIRPAKGLGLGAQLSLYRRAHDRSVPAEATREREHVVSQAMRSAGRGRYAPLREQLASRAGAGDMSVISRQC